MTTPPTRPDPEELLRRITGRRICPVCKSIYNVFSHPPKVEGKCDFDGIALEQRSDDTEEVFVERMKTFAAQTAPVVEHYRALGRFEEVDGERADVGRQPVKQQRLDPFFYGINSGWGNVIRFFVSRF